MVKLDAVVCGLLMGAALLLGANLGNGLLWQDEAETALLARHTLRFGYPRAHDGRSPMEIQKPYKHGPGEAWIYSPWAPFYLLAAVFGIFGESTAIARLPFAILGWVSITLTWRLARTAGFSVLAQRLSVAGLVFSVPFLLHMRQCRYYSMVTAAFVAICWLYLRWWRSPTLASSLGLGGLLGLLFHVNFGTFVPTVAALCFHQAWRGNGASRRASLWVAATAALIILPWAWAYYKPASFIGTFTLNRAAKHLEYYVRVTNKFLLPLAVIALSELPRLVARKPGAARSKQKAQVWEFFFLTIGVQMAFLLLPDQRHMRYLIPLLPLFAVIQAAWLARCIQWKPAAGYALAVIALGTMVLGTGRLRVPLADFTYELSHRYQGPMDAVVAFLNKEAHPGQRVKIPYDDRTLMFYTQLKIIPPSEFADETYPDWIVLRRDWLPDGFLESGYYARIRQAYERIEVDAPDILWQNREDPGSHHFRSVLEAPRVVIYRRRDNIVIPQPKA